MSVDGPEQIPQEQNVYNQILSQTAKRHRLVSVHWEMTYRCNEKCTHCYLDVFAPHANVPGELTTTECLRVLDELATLGVLNLSLSGGEIFVRRDFFQIAEYARSKKFLLRLFTNGIMISTAIADRIAALHPYAVEISLYSAHAETHDRITRLQRSWELTMRAFRLLRERNIRTVMKMPLMRETVHEIRAMDALAESVGAQLKIDTTITPKDTGGLDPLKHRVTWRDLVWYYRETIDPSLWIGRTLTDKHRTCGISMNAMLIDPYGNVSPCAQVRANAGNLRERPLAEIWQTSAVWQQVGNLTLGELPVCRTCELRTICTRCHGLALMEDGDLHAPATVNCREALARRQALIERGASPADYPVPAHLREYREWLETHEENVGADPGIYFIPLSALSNRKINFELSK